MEKTKINRINRVPDFASKDIAVWLCTDKNGRMYANVKIMGLVVPCFQRRKKVEPIKA